MEAEVWLCLVHGKRGNCISVLELMRPLLPGWRAVNRQEQRMVLMLSRASPQPSGLLSLLICGLAEPWWERAHSTGIWAARSQVECDIIGSAAGSVG